MNAEPQGDRPHTKKRYFMLLVCLGLFLGIGAVAYRFIRPHQDAANLLGSWMLVTTDAGGQIHHHEPDEMVLHFTEDRIVHVIDSEKTDERGWRIRPHRDPKELDLIPLDASELNGFEGENAWIDFETLMIYKLEGDSLSIAFTFRFLPNSQQQERRTAAEDAQKRPTSFDTREDDVWVTTYQRIKP